MPNTVLALATMDTKHDEICFVAECLRRTGLRVVLIDLSTTKPHDGADVSAREVAAAHPDGIDAVLGQQDRGKAVAAMSEALRCWMRKEMDSGKVGGAVAVGGSGGTALVAPAMQEMPVGIPKLILSTVASGDTKPYVGCSDITMMHSVVDIAGLNSVSKRVLSNAAYAMAGMVSHWETISESKRAVGLTMFGVTTPCVDAVRHALEAEQWDALVFHATGAGGQAMEKLVSDGFIEAVLDVTTTEVADEVVGGVMPCGPRRFDAIREQGVPCVMSLGALDMVNFGTRDTMPEKFSDRQFWIHNPQVTLMRTSVEENQKVARWIAAKVNQSTAPLEILIPERGVSMLDLEGQPFYDQDADAALFETLEEEVNQSDERRVVRYPYHINDPVFAAELVSAFQRVCNHGPKEE